jgi:hypothetical protein
VGNTVEALGDSGWRVAAEEVQAAIRVDEAQLNSYELGLNVTNLTPDAALTALFDGILPAQVTMVRADAHVSLTAPIDRLVLAARPQITALKIGDLRLEWGTMGVTAQGNVIADSAGFAEGDAVLRLENWRVALDIAEKMGLLAAKDRKLWDRAAQFMAKRSDGVEAIELPLRFKNGQTMIGPLPVGPAPRLRR